MQLNGAKGTGSYDRPESPLFFTGWAYPFIMRGRGRSTVAKMNEK